jgi:hypothetical protein
MRLISWIRPRGSETRLVVEKNYCKVVEKDLEESVLFLFSGLRFYGF